jgi:hypothetical protein
MGAGVASRGHELFVPEFLARITQVSCTHNQVFPGRRLLVSPDSDYSKTHL